MNGTASVIIGGAAIGVLIYATRGARPTRPASDGAAADVAIGRLRAAREALDRADADTAWHVLGDQRIDWQMIAAAVERYPPPQAPDLAALIRTGPRAFLNRLQAVATPAAINTLALLLAALTDTSAVLADPPSPSEGDR